LTCDRLCINEGAEDSIKDDSPLVVKVGIAKGPVDGIEDGCKGDIKIGSSLMVPSSASTKGLELAASKRAAVTATLRARSFGNKLGLNGRSEDGFEDSCSDGIGDRRWLVAW
jgi:hypothetical protein